MEYLEHKELDEDGNVIGYSVFPDAMLSTNVSKEGTVFLDNINSVYGKIADKTFKYAPNKVTVEALESEPEPTVYVDTQSMIDDILGK